MMETINIEVSSKVAEAYRNFTVNQRGSSGCTVKTV